MTDALVKLLWPLRFRGKVRLLSPLVPNTGQRVGNVFGSRVPLDLSDYVQRMVYLGTFERIETELLDTELKPGMTFVDVGANCGYFTYLAARNVGRTGHVLAVEPSPYVAGILESAIRENHLKNVTLARTALGPRSGELMLYVPPAEIANHAPSAIANPGWTPLKVPVQRLDDLLDAQAIDRVDVLKIDVEGFEGEVIAGASASLSNGRIGAMLVEFNEWCLSKMGFSASSLWDRIVAEGYIPDIAKPASFNPTAPPMNCFFRKP